MNLQPKKKIKNILVIGSGPIVIGQACEFDYSGTQACRVLKEFGYLVVLINSNPATIMTDPETADEVYIEPITPENIKEICLKHKIDSVLPTVGGQTGLNVAVEIAKSGFFEKYNIQLIGANISSINKAEDRKQFKQIIDELGYKMSNSYYVYNYEEAIEAVKNLEFPIIIRASFTLGGSGGSIIYNLEEYKDLVKKSLSLSMINEVVIEKSIVGWKEYELEVMKDEKGNVVIVCSIENIDPIGIHTGDSITVAPQLTLSDKEYQVLRNMSINIIKKIGISTGGSNIQFALHPVTREILVIEMNPRVSRSSALASKATGFPIAKIAAKLAIGNSLDKINNDITQSTPASFEPTIDYIVTKIPKFDFEKFKTSSPILGIQMKSVGETMSIGRTFNESFQKAIRSLESNKVGFDGITFNYKAIKDFDPQQLKDFIAQQSIENLQKTKQWVKLGHFERIFLIKDLFYWGINIEEIYEICQLDKWFLNEYKKIFDLEKKYWKVSLETVSQQEIIELKQNGFSDAQLGYFFNRSEDEIRIYRKEKGIIPVYKIVDTCAGEFHAITPYYYSSYEDETELPPPSAKPRVIILGGGPNRIGQGIEFDYMCVHASMALREMGYESIIINSNPETVSTDYDTSDMLFFEPVTREDTLNIIEAVNPLGVIVHYGGQTPLNLADYFSKQGVNILGTSYESIQITENRESFKNTLQKLGLLQPPNNTCVTLEAAKKISQQIGYPVLLRPSFVLGGRNMRVIDDEEELEDYFHQSFDASQGHPVLIDKFLEKAIEVDVDLICDGTSVVICGIMEHIEEAGVHSGDSACILPPQNLSPNIIKQTIEQSRKIAINLNVKGFTNIQFAVKNEELFFLEVNPRGSRTVPFVSKATGVPWVKIATKVVMGKPLGDKEKNLSFEKLNFEFVAVKEAVLPFNKFPDEDIILSPEMKSTGEVMGLGRNSAEAFYKSQIGANVSLPTTTNEGLLVSVKSKDGNKILDACKILHDLGFKIHATEGTHQYLKENNIPNKFVYKLGEGHPDISDLIINGKVKLIYNTPTDKKSRIDDREIRLLAKRYRISIFTAESAMVICSQAIREFSKRKFECYSIKKLDKNYTL